MRLTRLKALLFGHAFFNQFIPSVINFEYVDSFRLSDLCPRFFTLGACALRVRGLLIFYSGASRLPRLEAGVFHSEP